MTPDDMELVRNYAWHGSEESFATLVSRHVNLVYSVALRQLHDPNLAEEVTQATFIILARKAGLLGLKTIVSAWLCRTAQYAASDALRTQRRRQVREQEVYMQSLLNPSEPDSPTWPDIAPLLDAAMAELREKDHSAIVLRFFEGKDMKQVGAALGLSENAASKRVNFALEKLRRFFSKRGVNSTTANIAGTISANSIQAAPVALAKSVAAIAVAKGAAASGSTVAVIQGALKIMAWTKLKTAIITSAAVLLAVAGTTTLTVKAVAHYREKARDDAVWSLIKAPTMHDLHAAPPVVSIRTAKIGKGFGTAFMSDGRKQMAFNKSVGRMLQNAYRIREPRIIYPGKLPEGHYDYIVSIPNHQQEALQAAIKEKFGLAGKKVWRDTNVLILKVAKQNAPGFKPAAHPMGINLNNAAAGLFEIRNETMSNLAWSLELYLQTPVIDETGLTGRYDADLTWDGNEQNYNSEGMKQAILDQLGFELVPDNRTIEMLLVEKAK